jgi:hypothetical protein
MRPRVEDMSAELQPLYAKFKEGMDAAGIPFALNEVLRTKYTQAAYAAQGREWTDFEQMLIKAQWLNTLILCRDQIKKRDMKGLCNFLRLRAEMSPLPASDWYQVTWTLNSRHFANGEGKSDAFDIVILKNGRVPTWDTKWDGNKDKVGDYLEAARIGKAVGLDAGGLWEKRQDFPHYQLVRG